MAAAAEATALAGGGGGGSDKAMAAGVIGVENSEEMLENEADAGGYQIEAV